MHNYIKRIFLSILTFSFLSGFVYASELEFAQISDVHYSVDNLDMGKYLYFLSLSLKKHNTDFAVFLGDNVDKSRDVDVISFMQAVHGIRTPYYLVLGNNDAHRLSGLEKTEYLDIVSTFNRNQNEKENYYYFRPNSDFVCVVLDDTPDFAKSEHGQVPDEQLKWLDSLLQKYSNKLFIIFEHSPLLPPRVEYKLSMIDTEKYQEVLNKHSNVVLISSGHYHQESIQQDDKGIRHISAPAFKNMPHSYQLIKIIYDEKTYKTPKDVEIIVTRVKV